MLHGGRRLRSSPLSLKHGPERKWLTILVSPNMLCEGPDSSRRIRAYFEDPYPNKVGRSLSDNINQHVIAFYESEEYSRIGPGKKEIVVVRDGSVKSHKQKQLLLLNLHELYIAYKAK